MRFGCCVPIGLFYSSISGPKPPDGKDAVDDRMQQVREALQVVEGAGCDFVEFGVGLVAPEEPESAFERVRATLARSSLVPECFSSYIPSDILLVGDMRNRRRIEHYVAVSARRVAALGGQVIVFGSGKARSIPVGVSRDTAEAHLLEFLHLAADHARAHGIRVAIEPMNRSESNILTSVAEAVALADRVNRPEIGVLVDFYHLEAEKEPIAHITRAGKHLIHIHVADTGRLYPGSGSYDFPAFWRAIRSVGYDGRITVECTWRDFPAEAGPAIRFLRESTGSLPASP
jgi:sugar phosphate isomerase/epimerase